MPELSRTGAWVRVGNVNLRTPGLAGTATSRPMTPGTRGARLRTPAVQNALRNANVQVQELVEINQTREVPVGAVRTRSTPHGEPAIEVQVAAPGANRGQFVLYTDESGVATWHFARNAKGNVDVRGRRTRTYLVPRYVPARPKAGEARGVTRILGTKALQILVFPIVDPVIGKVGDYFAGKWERKKRPYAIRWFTPENWAKPAGTAIDREAWGQLAKGPALMFIHGTMSQAHTGFAGLPRDFVTRLSKSYEGRVFAFNHMTLSQDPKQNIEWFVSQIPGGTKLELDIICHSRGGLVSRILAERTGQLSFGSRQLTVRKVVFVATPNAGTILTDTKYMNDFIDSYTNLINFFPDNGFTDVLDCVITVAKQLAVGTVKGLNGLQCMRPNGPFLKGLNTGAKTHTTYFALASNFEPSGDGFGLWMKNRLMDRIFRAPNDLVVPTLGVYDANGAGGFPIDQTFVFRPSDSVEHSGYFRNAVAREKMADWLLSEP